MKNSVARPMCQSTLSHGGWIVYAARIIGMYGCLKITA